MELRSIRLINFRGYRDLKITFSNGLQMFYMIPILHPIKPIL